MESIDEVLSGLGENIDHARRKQQQSLSDRLQDMLKQLSPGLSGIKLRYDKGWQGDQLISALKKSLPQDLERGATGPGPHRADMPVYMDKKLAKEIISRGEQKSLSAALLLSQARQMSETGEKPVLLMDDLASEFDESHLDRVLAAARLLNAQIWITGTSYVPYVSMGDGVHAMFHVEQGTITTKTTS